jgi:hypothetical protein
VTFTTPGPAGWFMVPAQPTHSAARTIDSLFIGASSFWNVVVVVAILANAQETGGAAAPGPEKRGYFAAKQ